MRLAMRAKIDCLGSRRSLWIRTRADKRARDDSTLESWNVAGEDARRSR